MSRGKNCPHWTLETIFDSQLPSPKLSPKMPLKLSLAHKRGGLFSSFKITPAVRVFARQLRDKNRLAAILSRDIRMSRRAHWVPRWADFSFLREKKREGSQNFRPQSWGRKWLRQFYGCLALFGSFCWKTPIAHKIPRFMGGCWGFLEGGGGKCQFCFYGRGDFPSS